MKQLLLFVLLVLWACAMGQAVAERIHVRSSRWESVRNAFIKEHPTCAACGRKATQVHHVMPFHLHPELELDSKNLISLCDRDHLLFGHLDNFRSYNPHVREDCAAMLKEIKSRPVFEVTNGIQASSIMLDDNDTTAPQKASFFHSLFMAWQDED